MSGPADALALGAVAVSWALFAWLFLGWPRAELLSGWRLARSAARSACEALERTARASVARVRGALGADSRQRETTLGEVSEMIDIVRLGLLAGLSFDAALGLYCEARDTELAARLARARLSWQTGLASREDALMDAARDLGVRPLETFAVAVGQALELGAPLADTLAGQSCEIRAAHRASVERQIERAPVKLLIPTGTLILPALLLSILGPLLAASGMM